MGENSAAKPLHGSGFLDRCNQVYRPPLWMWIQGRNQAACKLTLISFLAVAIEWKWHSIGYRVEKWLTSSVAVSVLKMRISEKITI